MGSCNDRFVLKPEVAISSKVSIFSKMSLAITDVLAEKTQLVNQLSRKPPSWNPSIRDSQLIVFDFKM